MIRLTANDNDNYEANDNDDNDDNDFPRYHNSRMINYDARVGVDVSVREVQKHRLRSVLTVAGVGEGESGNYSCTPDNVSITLLGKSTKRS